MFLTVEIALSPQSELIAAEIVRNWCSCTHTGHLETLTVHTPVNCIWAPFRFGLYSKTDPVNGKPVLIVNGDKLQSKPMYLWSHPDYSLIVFEDSFKRFSAYYLKRLFWNQIWTLFLRIMLQKILFFRNQA